MVTHLGDTSHSSNNVFTSSSSSSCIFPLPFLPLPFRCISSTSSRIRQRYYRIRLSTLIINCIITSLNKLYSPLSYTKKTLFETASLSSSSLSPLLIHQRILHYLSSCVHTFISESRGSNSIISSSSSDINKTLSSSSFPLSSIYQGISKLYSTTDYSQSHSHTQTPPSPPSTNSVPTTSSLPLPSSSATSLPTSFPFSPSSSYFHSLPVAITPLNAATVSLPTNTTSVGMLDVLPLSWSSMYSSSTSGLLKPLHIVNENLLKLKLPKPSIHGSKKQYISLIQRLLQNQMITLSLPSDIKVINGLFTVTKDATSTRMIVDARYANTYFIDPPTVHLPTPASFISLSLPHGNTLYKCKTDLENFYHHIRLPTWLCQYFALPSISINQLPQTYVSSSTWLSFLPSSTRIHPVLTRLAMGFSHAVSIAQTMHEYILYSSKALSPTSHILNMTCPVITSTPIHAPYVDDNNMLGTCPIQLQYAYDRCIDAYANAGFPVKQSKCVLPTSTPVTMIGVSISSNGIVSLPIDRMHILLNATMYIITTRHSTGKLLASIIGSWTWCMLLRRFSLCIFRHVYRFISCAGDKDYILWPCVINELLSIISIVPLLRADMSCIFFDQIIATDASTTGAGMSATSINDTIFSSLFPLTGLHVHDLAFTSNSINDNKTTGTSTSSTAVTSTTTTTTTMILQQPHIYDRVSSTSILSSTLYAYNTISSTFWYDVFSFPWLHSSHINMLELNTVHTAIRWLLSHPHSISLRSILCIDNAASYYALRKGRSTKLLSTLRKIAALILVSGLSLSLLWVPSKINPADKASRVYSKKKNI